MQIRVDQADEIWSVLCGPAEAVSELVDLNDRLRELSDEIAARSRAPRAIILRSAGRRFLVSAPGSAAEIDAGYNAGIQLMETLSALTVPTVAVLEGAAIGPAWSFALACDLRIAVAGARVGSTEVSLGRLPYPGTVQLLTRIAGAGRCMELLLLSKVVAAATARREGLVQRTCQAIAVDAALGELAESLRLAGPVALCYGKEAVWGGSDLPLRDGARLEASLYALLQTTADRSEGIRSFAERRPTVFVGQ
jgi:enoyl-CoA hydratase/carnithine racemase